MLTLSEIAPIRTIVSQWKQAGKTVGFVPTMGNLHDGHLALIATARQHADHVVASIFVNPAQFGPGEDFASYPRTLAEDTRKLTAAHTDVLFAPAVEEIYPDKNQTWVDVDNLGEFLCGASRPGHFRGVTTVVSKLFNIVQPDLACFGEKDYQQLAIIQRMTRDLNFPIRIIKVPTVREADGLALSSRNSYLTESERSLAPSIHATLHSIRESVLAGNRDYAQLAEMARKTLDGLGFATDYIEIVNADSLETARPEDTRLVIAAAARLSKTRLIDNVSLTIVR